MRLLTALLLALTLHAPHAYAQKTAPPQVVESLRNAVISNSTVRAGSILDRWPDILLQDNGRVGAIMLETARSNEMLDRLFRAGANMYFPTPSGLPVYYNIKLPFDVSSVETRNKYDLVKMLKEGRVEDALKVLVIAPNLAHAWQAGSRRTMLHEAARCGHVALIDAIIAEGVDVTRLDEHGAPPITATAWGSRTDAYRRMVDHHGIKPTVHAAAASGTLGELRAAIEANPGQLNVGWLDGATPLHLAVQADRPDAVAVLLDAGASTSEVMSAFDWAWRDRAAGGTPMDVAARHDRVQCLRVMLSKGVDPGHFRPGEQDRPVNSSLFDAVAANSIASAKVLLAHDPSLVHVSQYDSQMRPLDFAQSAEMIRLLLDAGADVRSPETPQRRARALTTAVNRGDAESVQMLLRAGAPIGEVNRESDPLVLIATKKGFANIVALLLEHGASPRAKGRLPHDAMQVAIIRDDPIIAELLVRAGYSGVRDADGRIVPSLMGDPKHSPYVWGMLERLAKSESAQVGPE